MVSVELTVAKFKDLEDHGSVLNDFDHVYYYNPEVATHLFRRPSRKWEFVALTIDEVESPVTKAALKKLVAKHSKWGNEKVAVIDNGDSSGDMDDIQNWFGWTR